MTEMKVRCYVEPGVGKKAPTKPLFAYDLNDHLSDAGAGIKV